mmetsp:Transcript_21131/g.47916  ORF Transcript_21131/g.47916 Transcript_21131/m.47916 type:complete len:311 (-) Transcript_21131:324-1256(-)
MVSRERFEMKFSSFVRRPQAEAVVLVPGGALHVQRLRRERILGVGVERAPVLALSRKDDGVPGGQHPDEFVRPRKVFVQGAVVRVALVRPPGDLAVFAVTVGFEQLRVPIVIGREEKRLNEFVVSEATRGFRNSFARAAYLARTARRAVRQRGNSCIDAVYGHERADRRIVILGYIPANDVATLAETDSIEPVGRPRIGTDLLRESIDGVVHAHQKTSDDVSVPRVALGYAPRRPPGLRRGQVRKFLKASVETGISEAVRHDDGDRIRIPYGRTVLRGSTGRAQHVRSGKFREVGRTIRRRERGRRELFR